MREARIEQRLRTPGKIQRVNRIARWQRKLGITETEAVALEEKIHGKCECCGRKEGAKKNGDGSARSLSVDHDHQTGKIRGFLCSNCNRAIGLMADDPVILRKAVAYLEKR